MLSGRLRTVELTAILYSLARRNHKGRSSANHMNLQLNIFGRFLLTPNGGRADLTERETIFFELIAKSPRNLVSKKQFVEAIGLNWLDFDNRRIDTFISRLRKRIFEQTNIELKLKADRQGNYYLMDMIDLLNT